MDQKTIKYIIRSMLILLDVTAKLTKIRENAYYNLRYSRQKKNSFYKCSTPYREI